MIDTGGSMDEKREHSGERRRSNRQVVEKTICVNDGVPYNGGLLHDVSSGGAVKYARGMKSQGKRPRVNDPIDIRLDQRVSLPGCVVRVFEDGFAVRFDWARDRYPMVPRSRAFA